MNKPAKIFIFCICCIVFIGCDRFTKNLAKRHLKDKPSYSYLHDTVRLIYVENTGAAMSLGDGLSKTASFWLLSIIPLLFLIGLFFYAIKNIDQFKNMKTLALALIFSGGIGNIIDRILFDRHVTDFLNVGIGNFRTGIFNIADMCVSTGVIGLLFFLKDNKKIEANNLSVQ